MGCPPGFVAAVPEETLQRTKPRTGIASQQGKDRLFILGAGTNGDPQGTGTLRPHLTPHADSRWTPGLHVNNKCFTHGEENLEYFYDFRVRNGFFFKYTFCSLQHA